MVYSLAKFTIHKGGIVFPFMFLLDRDVLIQDLFCEPFMRPVCLTDVIKDMWHMERHPAEILQQPIRIQIFEASII